MAFGGWCAGVTISSKTIVTPKMKKKKKKERKKERTKERNSNTKKGDTITVVKTARGICTERIPTTNWSIPQKYGLF